VVSTSLWPFFTALLIILIIMLCMLCVELAAYRRFVSAHYLWSPYGIGQTIIFCPVISIFFLVLSFFFPRLMSALGDWMSTMLPHMVWP